MKHNTVNSAWVSVDNKVYDVTDFIYDHPAGSRLILQNAGKDITYHARFHSSEMMKILKPRLVGRIVEELKEGINKDHHKIEQANKLDVHIESHTQNYLRKKGGHTTHKSDRSSSSL